MWEYVEPAGYYTHIMVDLTETVSRQRPSPWQFWEQSIAFEALMKKREENITAIAHQKYHDH